MLRRGRIMASLQERNGSYRILFCHHGKLHTFTQGALNDYIVELNTALQAEADSRIG